MAEQVYKFKTNPNSLSPAEYGVITAAEIMQMTTNEFLHFKGQLANVRERTRYDTAVYEKGLIKAGLTVDLFRRGIGDKEKFANSNNEFTKTLAHTNMPRKGEFPQGSLIIIWDVVAKKAVTSGLAAGITDGIITNPKATFPGTIDPALVLLPWLEHVHLAYREDEADKIRNYLGKFTQNEGVSGVIGASAGGVVQNFAAMGYALRRPRSLEGGQDFSCQLTHAADYDTSTASGIDQVVSQRIELETIEVIADRP